MAFRDESEWPRGFEPEGRETTYGFTSEKLGITGLPQSVERRLNGMKERLRKPTGTSATYHGKLNLSMPTEILFCGEALSSDAKILWATILYFCDDANRPASPYFPPIRVIAGMMGKSVASVHKYMLELKEAGLVESKQIAIEGEVKTRNHYDLPDIVKWWRKIGKKLRDEKREKKEGKYGNIGRYQRQKKEQDRGKSAESRV